MEQQENAPSNARDYFLEAEDEKPSVYRQKTDTLLGLGNYAFKQSLPFFYRALNISIFYVIRFIKASIELIIQQIRFK